MHSMETDKFITFSLESVATSYNRPVCSLRFLQRARKPKHFWSFPTQRIKIVLKVLVKDIESNFLRFSQKPKAIKEIPFPSILDRRSLIVISMPVFLVTYDRGRNRKENQITGN